MKLSRFLSTPTGGVTRASAPAADGQSVPTDAGTILAIALDVGAETLRAGGEIHRVEDTVTRICRAYGAEAVEVFAITSLITAEVRMPDGSYATRNRRVLSTYNHLARLEALNALSRTICKSPISMTEVHTRLESIRKYRPVPEWLCYLGGMLATGGFAVFFDGTLWDGMAASVIAFFLTLFARLRPVRINGMVRSLISSFAAGVLSVLCVSLGFGDHVDKIIIGTIMLEIPGLSFGNALRDLLCGDTLAGTMRFIQAIVQALMIALGYMAALVLFNQQIGG
ncbi:MAG: threonine/serine exporter family protein [Clostridia bacterium]|nr:threonine/serine exporter family protein [Clostridia bacterium]MBQ9131524.1 threonine/serine exporter family protein [Clostridia bacterium]